MKVSQFLYLFFGVAVFLGLFCGFVEAEQPEVRLIYLLPNDRTPQPDIDAKLDGLIKEVQQFYADEMARHGYGRKTFRFEADNNGDAIVHHVDGLYNDFYYRSNVGANITNIYGELQERFDFSKNIYIVSVEISTDVLNEGTETEACGAGGEYGFGGEDVHGGHVYLPASGSCFEDLNVSIHELGHAFGLQHDFRNSAYVMSYSGFLRNELSACAAHWLNVHPHFNPDKVLTRNRNTIIDLLSHEFDATPPHALNIRFEVNDPDGLVQAQLLTDTTGTSLAADDPEMVNCKELHGTREVVEFDTTRILNAIWIQVIDKEGNYIRKQIDVDFTTLIPNTEGAFIPDSNLAAAIREALNYPPGKQITTFDITKLQTLTATNLGITNLTGLEHAVAIESLDLSNNQIQDLTPLSSLPRLRELYLDSNLITDLTQVSGLTQLTRLILSANQLSDLTPLANLRQLTDLVLDNPFQFDGNDEKFKPVPGFNEIRDITPLAHLTQLTYLRLTGNQVSDLTPLANLTQLKRLFLGFNQIQDITALEDLIHLERLVLQENQISDIRPLKRLVLLWHLYLDDNSEIEDITALQDLTRLKYLQLGNSKITDLTPLSQLTGLFELDVRNNLITDITPLANLTQLKALTLFNNRISNITPLVDMTQLYELGLSYNQIVDITPLSRLTELEWLALGDNQIVDLTPLSRLTKVGRLALGNNQVSDVRPLLRLVNLKQLWIYGNPIQDRELLLTLLRRNPEMVIYHKRGVIHSLLRCPVSKPYALLTALLSNGQPNPN